MFTLRGHNVTVQSAEGGEAAATILIAEDDRRVRDSLDRYLRLEGYEVVAVPESDRVRIFERFHRLEPDRDRPGSGLGLAIVRQVAQVHGGQVFAGVSPLGGAAVGLRIPEIHD